MDCGFSGYLSGVVKCDGLCEGLFASWLSWLVCCSSPWPLVLGSASALGVDMLPARLSGRLDQHLGQLLASGKPSPCLLWASFGRMLRYATELTYLVAKRFSHHAFFLRPGPLPLQVVDLCSNRLPEDYCDGILSLSRITSNCCSQAHQSLCTPQGSRVGAQLATPIPWTRCISGTARGANRPQNMPCTTCISRVGVGVQFLRTLHKPAQLAPRWVTTLKHYDLT